VRHGRFRTLARHPPFLLAFTASGLLIGLYTLVSVQPLP